MAAPNRDRLVDPRLRTRSQAVFVAQIDQDSVAGDTSGGPEGGGLRILGVEGAAKSARFMKLDPRRER
jgi:hypothetical protein